MSTVFQKFIAAQELQRRQIQEAANEVSRIQRLPDDELKKILAEPEEDEE